MRHHTFIVLCTAAAAACAEPDAPEVDTTASASKIPDEVLDHIIRVEHEVVIAPDRRVAVTETFTLRAFLRTPRRAMLMIPAQGSRRSTYNMPFDGYDGGAILARAGFFAFTVDPEGSGDSTYPDNGFSVTYESEAASLHVVAERIQRMRSVPRIDVLGEELAGGVATHLCSDAAVFRSCTMASMIYRDASDFFDAFIAPVFEDFMASAPGGYFTTFPELYFNVLAGASPEVAAWFLATQGGTYAAGPYIQDFERFYAGGASYDPRHAAVPGLIIMGEFDPNPAPGDAAHLADEYGSLTGAGPAAIEVIEGGSHIVRIDAAPRGPRFWELVLEFVDPA